VIEMGCGKNDAGLPYLGYFLDTGPAGGATVAIAPGLKSGIEPASVRQNADDSAMRPPAALANAAGTLEAHVLAELRPVDRVEPAHLSPDRHYRPRSPHRSLFAETRLISKMAKAKFRAVGLNS
jgi:hypothetical protein